ncbi:MAG: hypothetical protein QM723_39585 [Myxococcaceae bacterium]
MKVSGYIDVGASKAENNGRGFIIDTTGAYSSRFPGVAWVLLGDPWSTAVNSRGEPADTKGSFAFTHNPVASNGALTFLINEINLDFSSTPWPSVFVFASIDFMPRTGFRGTLGDFFDADYAYVDWTPFDNYDITFTAGKFDSVFGREYRIQESPDRNGIVPSLLFRYVGGHPVGLKARGKFLDKRLIVAVAVLNGSSFIETMNYSDDVDRNDVKTVSGRISYDVPLPFHSHIDIGLSGEAGAQGRQIDNSIIQWQYGFDVLLEFWRLAVKAEFVRGLAPGGGIDEADYLNYRSWHVEIFGRVLPWLGVLARYEERHAINRHALDWVYFIEIARVVAGIRIDPLPNLAFKVEYCGNLELSPLPSFPNDVFNSSMVVSF